MFSRRNRRWSQKVESLLANVARWRRSPSRSPPTPPLVAPVYSGAVERRLSVARGALVGHSVRAAP